MMYYYWVRHGIRPSVFMGMSAGELLIIRAFFEHERDEINKAVRGKKPLAVIDILQAIR